MSTETNGGNDRPDPTNLAALLGNLIGVGIALLIDLLSKSRR